MAGWYRPPGKLGMYMHGTVGTGKTFLMDLFYKQVPVRRKRRVHFHSFMWASLIFLDILRGQISASV
jgi:cell division protein ZapE